MSTDAVTVETAMDGDIKNDVRGLAASYTSASEQKLIEKKALSMYILILWKMLWPSKIKFPASIHQSLKFWWGRTCGERDIQWKNFCAVQYLQGQSFSLCTYFIMESDGKDKYLKELLKE